MMVWSLMTVAAARAHIEGEEISDLQARVIANAWHGGMWSAFYSFTSTGAILEGDTDHHGRDFRTELSDAIVTAALSTDTNESDMAALHGLRAYAEKHGPRGPQHGWANLKW